MFIRLCDLDEENHYRVNDYINTDSIVYIQERDVDKTILSLANGKEAFVSKPPNIVARILNGGVFILHDEHEKN